MEARELKLTSGWTALSSCSRLFVMLAAPALIVVWFVLAAQLASPLMIVVGVLGSIVGSCACSASSSMDRTSPALCSCSASTWVRFMTPASSTATRSTGARG